jgi:long-chain acyl-CoA synthetase
VSSTPEHPLQYFWGRFAAAEQSECAAFGDERWTYGDLCRRISQDVESFTAMGIAPGQVVVTAGEFCLQHLSVFFSLAKLAVVHVPLPEVRETEVAKCADIANALHILRVTREGRWSLETREQELINPLLMRYLSLREAGLIVFTSGSTGEKKAVLHSIPRLLKKFMTPRRGLRTLSFLKLDHLGGINTVLYALSNRGGIVFPRGRTVDEICRQIELYKVQLLPTTPSFLNLLLLSGAHLRHDLSSLELITYGTEVMPEQTLKHLTTAFPGVRIQQTYGLTELGVFRSKSRDSDSLWVKVGGEGYETRVMNGTLWVRADAAMEGYLNYPSPFLDGGWYDTGDRVEVDGEYMRFMGRESEVVNVGGEKVYPAEVENFLLGLSDVKDAVVCAEPNPLLGNIVVAHVVRKGSGPESEALHRIKTACRKNLQRFMVPVKIYFEEDLEYSDRYKKVRRRT